MRYRYYEINSTKKTLTYFLYVIVVLWFFAGSWLSVSCKKLEINF